MRNAACLLAAAAMATTLTFAAAPLAAESPHQAAQGTQSAAAPMIEGEVRTVDKDAGKIALKHAAIPNLEMPAMSMVFRVKDPAMLDKVKAGDKVRFTADKVGGAFTITQIEPAR